MYQTPMVTNDDRLWGMLAHILGAAGMLLSVATLQWAGPLVVWLYKRDSSTFAAFHGLQSLLFQLAWFAIFWVVGIVLFIISVMTLGLGFFIMVPIMFALSLVPLIWSVVAGLKANAGEWYEYPVVGPYARRSLGI